MPYLDYPILGAEIARARKHFLAQSLYIICTHNSQTSYVNMNKYNY